MGTKAFVGLDVHRKLVVATALDARGKQIRQASFGPAPKELRRFLSELPKPTRVVIEATNVWERYFEAAPSTGAEVVVSNPTTTRMIAEASIKTDKVDSATLANLLRLDSIPLVFVPSPEDRATSHDPAAGSRAPCSTGTTSRRTPASIPQSESSLTASR